jgi:hypothetical protein
MQVYFCTLLALQSAIVLLYSQTFTFITFCKGGFLLETIKFAASKVQKVSKEDKKKFSNAKGLA